MVMENVIRMGLATVMEIGVDQRVILIVQISVQVMECAL